MLLTSGLSKRSQVVRVQHMMMFSLADESIWLLCTSSLCEPHLACKIKKNKKIGVTRGYFGIFLTLISLSSILKTESGVKY